ncbi:MULTISPECIES: TolC family protein [unclassified Polaribacter]|uniref:TolC family protein n=1 Tax=unclassified Polaribacter TaxID=196858 RepID=UPI0011BE5B84|nr:MULTISPECIES: TolC family protein [unclassified Polaribacter]TXD54083.1 TolC family protein [Polaribacter sp. IC063]TXD62599.1 TolC family protein [Polaribacter sp. IC066]
MKTKVLVLTALLISMAVSSQKQWTLKECVDEALKRNISIQQNRLSLELAEKDVDISKGNFLPNLNAGTGSNLNFGTSFDPTTQNRISTTFLSGTANLSSGITIFNGFRNTNIYKQAQLGVESSKLDLEQIENDISLFVVNSYLNILFAKENLSASRVQYKISKTQIEAAEARFKAGVVPKGDLLNAQATAATNQQTIVTQENALDIALLNLAQALQVSLEGFDVAPVNIGEPSENLFYTNSSSVYDKSLDRMPEIERAKLAIENSDLNIEISKAAFLPTLNASLAMGTNFGFNLNLPDGFSNPTLGNQLENNFGYGGGFNMSIPIFNRFQTKNRVAQSMINKEISETRLINEKLNLKQTIEQSFLDVKTALKTFEVSKISLGAQEEAFKNAQESYNYGSITQFDFDQVRTRLVNAQATLIRSKYDYVFKTKVLQFYAGDLILE